MSILVDFSIFPVDKGESISQYVAKVVSIIKQSALTYSLGPMGTCIEGEWEEVIEIINKCFYAMKEESNRVYMVLKVDYRKDKSGRITKKIDSVLKKIK